MLILLKLEVPRDLAWLLLCVTSYWVLLANVALIPKVVVTEDGICGDSVLSRWQIPWRYVVQAHGRMSIVVELSDGRRIPLRAVERARAAVIFRRESVVDRVAAQMEEARVRWQSAADDRVALRRWPTLLTRDAMLIAYLPLLLMLAVRLVIPWT
jgi:hypothetical protein